MPCGGPASSAVAVGTYDGFWAFQMERRGAEVVVIDLDKLESANWPPVNREALMRDSSEWGMERGNGFSVALARAPRGLSGVSTLEVWILPAGDAQAALAGMLDGRAIQRAQDGKPWVAGGPHFNLSHSGELALIAVCGDAPVGVDLEREHQLRNPSGLARRMCSPRELEWASGGADLNAALLRLWVRKEAVAKAEGGGIATALSGIDVLDPLVSAHGSSWFVHDLPEPAPGYLAAVSWQADCR